VDAVFGACLESREIALGIDLIGDLKDILRADLYAQAAAFAPVFVNFVFISHKTFSSSEYLIYMP
jgi:hypothetical protein